QRNGARRRASPAARPADPGGALMSTPYRGTDDARPPRLADAITRAVTGCLGAGMMLLPAPQLTGRSVALVPIGVLLVAVSLAVPVPVSAWLLVAGAGAAVAAVVIALPRRPGQPREPR